MRNLMLPLAVLATATCVQAQEMATEVKTTEIAPGIYMLEGANGFSSNIGLLVGDEHVLLVDDGMAPITADLLETVEELAGKPADFVVNTQVHGDHVGSNAALAAEGAVIFAHENLRERLAAKPEDAGGPAGLPVITFGDAVTFHVNGQEAYVFHLESAHTDGDAVIHFRDANVIDTGDLFFNYMYPFIDLDSGGTVDGYISAQQKIIAMSDDSTKIIPGHGPLADRDDLQVAVDMLIDGKKRVQKLVAAGMSADDVVAANPLADYHDTWDWGFISTERMTRTLYRDLTAD